MKAQQHIDWLNPRPWLAAAGRRAPGTVETAMASRAPGIREFAALISPAAAPHLEAMARRAQALTRRHFGRTISLYVPLYLSNHCSGGCVYCGFAADRRQPRRRLEPAALRKELKALKKLGFEDVLLLTGERVPQAGFPYLLGCVAETARHFHNVTVESFAMSESEYRELAQAGCTGMTLYQETYDPRLYRKLHRWGPKRDFGFRLGAPERALAAGFRTAGIGALLGLGNPRLEALALFQHVEHLRKTSWQGGITISFPRMRPQLGGFRPGKPVDDRLLAQLIFAFRITFPDIPLVLSTREVPHFRDGMAGVGISRMSVASRTTVGGYSSGAAETAGQFEVNDTRGIAEFFSMLRRKKLEPVFKNWDAVFQAKTEE